MAYQTEQKLKNLIHQVGGIPEQHGQLQRSSQVFVGRVSEVLSDKLKVQRLKEDSVAQDGTITWPTGSITGAHIDYVQVYGVAAASIGDVFPVGSTVIYVPFDGSGANQDTIRGTYITVPMAGASGFWAKINSATRDGYNYRWVYSAMPVKIISSGAPHLYASHSITTTTHNGVATAYAYNTIEMNNGASGLMGTGINTFDVPSPMVPVTPVPANTVVWINSENVWTYSGSTVRAWFFTYENSVSGGCT